MTSSPEKDAASIVDRVKNFIINEPGFEFVKVAGSGAYGTTIAVKTINYDLPNEEIAPERRTLERLIWAMHIVTLIQPPFRSNPPAWFKDNTLITEYVENGTLARLKGRVWNIKGRRQRKLPNRVLWAIFLCLTRACIGIAYPPGDLSKAPSGPRDQILEVLPTDDRPPSKVHHDDLHEGNIMIGDLDQDEHRYFPGMKIIDFGLAPSDDDAVNKNIYVIGIVMSELIWYDRRTISDLVNDKRGANTLDPDLDLELLTLAIECARRIPAPRPSLSRLFTTTSANVLRTYPDIPEESDSYIKYLVQRHWQKPEPPTTAGQASDKEDTTLSAWRIGS
ncbi:hypothetical protein O1611_g1477 [Lasiodiplodia mahajangana]|uniref:Uncharacterized protein n=1 Tax=Lasiodiplodia mahajangana TaxID=1108764 RepID=A0ACC2JXK0_9PEZI|nr:hypothetical protein O1611_g1477 [Lasiodiplodia mahajangana]